MHVVQEGNAFLAAFQFHMVRLRRHPYKDFEFFSEFQFHMVRLRLRMGLVGVSNYNVFQFHMVRLRLLSCLSCALVCLNFNSTWYD